MSTSCYKSHFDQFLIASKKVMKNNSNFVLKETRKNPYELFKKKKKEWEGALWMACTQFQWVTTTHQERKPSFEASQFLQMIYNQVSQYSLK